MPIRINLKQ